MLERNDLVREVRAQIVEAVGQLRDILRGQRGEIFLAQMRRSVDRGPDLSHIHDHLRKERLPEGAAENKPVS